MQSLVFPRTNTAVPLKHGNSCPDTDVVRTLCVEDVIVITVINLCAGLNE